MFESSALLAGPNPVWIVVLVLILDALAGDPDWIYRRVPHPVVLIGRLIERLDTQLNDPSVSDASSRARGFVMTAVLMILALIAGWLLARLVGFVPGGWVVEVIIASALIAQRSLVSHVRQVALALESKGLGAARMAVSMIVGRDPDRLDEHAIARAAIESSAENFSDGVVAPVFWYAFFGLPGLILYKTINTADSMVGHRSLKYRFFGTASARLDDVLNLVPARLGGGLLVLVSPIACGGGSETWRRAWRTMLRDAPAHRSPNAGWLEAPMAGALDLALAGPRQYGPERVEDAWMGDGSPEATAADIRRALRMVWLAWGVMVAVLVLAGCLVALGGFA